MRESPGDRHVASAASRNKDSEILEFVIAVSAARMRAGFKDGRDGSKAFVTGIKTDLEKVEGSFKKLDTAIERYAKRWQSHLGSNVTATRGWSQSVGAHTGKVEKAYADLELKIAQKLNSGINSLARFDASTKTFQTNVTNNVQGAASAFLQSTGALQTYQTQLNNTRDAANLASNALSRLNNQANKAPSGLGGGGGQGGGGGGAPGGPGAPGGGGGGSKKTPGPSGTNPLPSANPETIKAITASLDGLNTKLQDTEKAYGAMAGTAAKALAIVGAAVVKTTKTFVDYDMTVNRFKAVVDDLNDQTLNKFTDLTFKMGSTTQFGARAVASAGVELAKLGFTAREVIGLLPAVLDAATAGQVELAEAAEIVATTMRGFLEKDIAKAAHYVDVLAVAAARSAVDFKDMGETFKYVSGIASASSQNVEEMSALIAIMGNNMIKGSQAGTSLRMALTRLQRPTAQARDVLELLNIEIGDKMTGKMRSLPAILKDLQAGMAGLDETTRNAAVATIFGQEALSGMMAIINQSPEAIDKMIDAMYESDGAARKMADTSFRGLGAELQKLSAQLETVTIGFGDALEDGMMPFIDQARQALTAIDQLPRPIKETVVETVAWVAQIGLLVLALSGARAGIAKVSLAIIEMIGQQRLARIAMGLTDAASIASTGFYAKMSDSLKKGATQSEALRAGVSGLAGAIGSMLLPKLAILANPGTWAFVAAITALGLAIGTVIERMKELKSIEESDRAFEETLKNREYAMKQYTDLVAKMNEEGNKGKSIIQLAKEGKISPEQLTKAAAGLRVMQGNAIGSGERYTLSDVNGNIVTLGQEEADRLGALSDEYRTMGQELARARQLGAMMIKQQDDWNALMKRADMAETDIDKKRLLEEAKNVKAELDKTLAEAQKNRFIDVKTLQDTHTKQKELELLMQEATKRGGKDETDKVLKGLNERLRILQDNNKAELLNLDIKRKQLALAKENAKMEGDPGQAIPRKLLYAKDMFPKTGSQGGNELRDKLDAYFQSSTGLTRTQMSAFEKGMSSMQYADFLNSPSTDPKAVASDGYVATNQEMLALEKGFLSSLDASQEEFMAAFEKLKDYQGEIVFKIDGQTNEEMIAGLNKMSVEEFRSWLNENILPDAPFDPEVTADILRDMLGRADFGDNPDVPATPTNMSVLGMGMGMAPEAMGFDVENTYDWFKNNWSAGLTEIGMPGIKLKDFNEDSDFLEGKNAQLQTYYDQLSALRDDFEAGGYKDEVAELDKDLVQIRADIISGELEFSKDWNEVIGKNEEEMKKALSSRADEARKNGKQLLKDMKELRMQFKDVLADLQGNFEGQTMNQAQAAEAAKAQKLYDLQIKIDNAREKIKGTFAEPQDRENALKDLAELENQAKEVGAYYDENIIPRAKRLLELEREKYRLGQLNQRNDESIRAATDRMNRPDEIDPDTEMIKFRSVEDKRADLVDAEKQKLQGLQDQLTAYNQLSDKEKESEANQQAINEVKNQYGKTLARIIALEADEIQQTDKQANYYEQLRVQLHNVGIVMGRIAVGASVARDLFAAFAGDNRAMQETAQVFGALANSFNAIQNAFKMAKEGKDAMSIVLATTVALANELGTITGLFPDVVTIRRESASFAMSMQQMDAEISRARIEASKQAGILSAQAYYEGMREVNQKELQATLAQIEEEYTQAVEGSMGFFDIFTLLFQGKFTKETQTRLDRLRKIKDTKVANANEQAEFTDLETAKQSLNDTFARKQRLDALESARELARVKRGGNPEDIIDAEHQSRMDDIKRRKDALGNQLFFGEIDFEEYQKQLDALLIEETDSLDQRIKARKDYHNELRQMMFDHQEFEATQIQNSLQQQLKADDIATERALEADRARMRELENLGLTGLDEYKLLKQREVDVLKASADRKLDIERQYYAEVKKMQIDLVVAQTALTADQADDLAAQRDSQLADLNAWKGDMIDKMPEMASVINNTYAAKAKKIQLDYDLELRELRAQQNEDTRALLRLEAEATEDMLDDVQAEYATAILAINEQEQLALQSYKLTEQQKVEASRKATAERLKAQKVYQEQIKDMAVEQLQQAKKIREMMYKEEARDGEARLRDFEHQLNELDLTIREKELALARIREKYAPEKAAVDDMSLAQFEAAQAAIDLQNETREALKFNKVNITGNANDAAAGVTQREAIEAWAAEIEKKAQSDRILKEIDDVGLNDQLKRAALLRARFSLTEISNVREKYSTEIAELQAQGKDEEEIDLTRKQRDREVEDLRKMYAENFERYKELEIKAVEAKESVENEALRRELDGLELRRLAIENNAEAERIALDTIKLKWEEDAAYIDAQIDKLQNAHLMLSITVDQLRENFEGTIDSIVAEYERLWTAADQGSGRQQDSLDAIVSKFNVVNDTLDETILKYQEMFNAVEKVKGSMAGMEGSSGSSSSSSLNLEWGRSKTKGQSFTKNGVTGTYSLEGDGGWYYYTSSDAIKGSNYDKSQSKSSSSSSKKSSSSSKKNGSIKEGFVDGGYNDYDDKGNTRTTNPAYMTDAQKKKAYGLAGGGLLPWVPGKKNRDIFPTMLAPSERVLSYDDNKSLMSQVGLIPKMLETLRDVGRTGGLMGGPGLLERIGMSPSHLARTISAQPVQVITHKTIEMTNHVRDDNDIAKIEGIVKGVMKDAEIDRISVYGPLAGR